MSHQNRKNVGKNKFYKFILNSLKKHKTAKWNLNIAIIYQINSTLMVFKVKKNIICKL